MAISIERIRRWDVECERHVSNLVRELVRIIKDKNLPDVSILDVGSNVGKFVGLLSTECTITNAILVEPLEELQAYAKGVYPDYIFETMLVSDTRGILPLYIASEENLGISRILDNPDQAKPDEIRFIPCESICTILRKHSDFVPNVIKIDAEGHDIKIVEALFGYVYRSGIRPIILFECNGGVDVNELCEKYTTIGYTVHCDVPMEYSRDVFLIPA